HARAGQRVVIECWAERLDSKLRAVLELEDEGGRRLASSRGYTGLDPLLDIDTGPRVESAWPNVVERGKTTRVTLFGRNLTRAGVTGTEPPGLDRVDV